jgi:Serine carboxypeptidase
VAERVSPRLTTEPAASAPTGHASRFALHRHRSWFNDRCRGPGCSSIGGGFLSELGPFYPTPDAGKLVSSKMNRSSTTYTHILDTVLGCDSAA